MEQNSGAPAAPQHNAPAPGRKAPTALILGAVAVVAVLVALAAAGWYFLSPDRKATREIQSTLQSLSSVATFNEFAAKLCAQYRPDTAMIDELTQNSQQSGVDFDRMFTEQIRQNFPSTLDVTHLDRNGDNATASVETSDPQGNHRTENVQMRHEDGAWKVCDPAIGGAPPSAEAPA